MSDYVENILSGSKTAFIDASNNSNLAYKPSFIFNDFNKKIKVSTAIEEELRKCSSFCFSVAFIKKSGIQPFFMVLKELEKRGIPGKILTTDYNTFTEPDALDKLAKFSNIELRMYRVGVSSTYDQNNRMYQEYAKVGFHTKGYIFADDSLYTIIIGSSNLTDSALAKNKEWNTRFVSTKQGELYKSVSTAFDELWNDKTHTKKYDEFIEDYRTRYESKKKQEKVAKNNSAQIISLEQYNLSPNSMQSEFITNLRKLINDGENRALLISSTGTGKTLASAFGIRDALAAQSTTKRILFVVHREQIAKQAMKAYGMVFGNEYSYGLLSGNSKVNGEVNFLFATMQMISKEEIYSRYPKNYFQTIVVDEAHHTGAESYKKIMNYFEPEFWLGMTASPERMDGFDVFELFNHNIASEIRLQQALEEELLCPFHYYGITDYEIDGDIIDDATKLRNFNNLISTQRVDYIIEQIQYYGYSGDRVKGLIFCSDKNEARKLSEMFNERGYKTISLTSDDDQTARESAIERLAMDVDPSSSIQTDYLDYIFTVDIFNEGVDIPEINQVVMLRPTQSAIIFVQQLGRGLRRYRDKDYVVIIDFIGNYLNNFMIPIALSGDRTYNKDNLRKYVMEEGNVIPGISSIHFDEISKKRIFDSIDMSKTPLKFLRDKYQNLKNKLGKVPGIMDFYKHGEVDPILFIEYIKGSYDKFVRKVDADANLPIFTDQQSATLDFVSLNLANGKRIHELLILKGLIKNRYIKISDLESELKKYNVQARGADIKSALRFLSLEFVNTLQEKEKYSSVKIINSIQESLLTDTSVDFETGNANLSTVCESYFYRVTTIQEKQFLAELESVVEYGIQKYKDYYSDSDEDNLVLYQKYSRKDVCRLLNWERDDSSTMYGYRIKHGTCPIFVTYEKKDNISESTKYPDKFVNDSTFSWMTRSGVKLESTESKDIIGYRDNGLKMYLFVKKSDDEGSDFYYMGKVTPKSWKQTTISGKDGKVLPIMNFILKLDNSVRNDIYEYFTK